MEPIKQTLLLPLPEQMNKIKFEKIYLKQFPDRTIRNGINEIIYDNRKNWPEHINSTRAKILSTHTVKIDEIREFVQIYGLPHGYFMPDGY